MIRHGQWGLLTLSAFFALACQSPAAAGPNEDATVQAAHEVLQQFQALQFREIPESLLADVHAVAIIPDVIKLGFVVGGQRGHGVVVIRQPDGSWRAPLFVTITGGSIGWQVGAQATDFVLVFKSQKSVDGLLRGKFTLGADAAIAAGPVGRRVGAGTDAELKAEIYSYSRSRGLFAGVSLDGSALQVDDRANANYYAPALPGSPPTPAPQAAQRLVQIIATLASHTMPAAEFAGTPTTIPATTIEPAGNPVESDQTALARSAVTLNSILDESWRKYLALPAEVFDPARRPSLQAMETSLQRFAAVAQNRQYQALSGRQEFGATYQLLQKVCDGLRASSSRQLSLPPPPQTR